MMQQARIALVGAAVALCAMPARAFESDVHFGLTRWLAVQAGFAAGEAQAIALGNQRVDSGDIQFIETVNAYACAGRDPVAAESVRAHHFASSKAVPAPPDGRSVVAGGEAAWKSFEELLRVGAGKESLLLYKLGEALHVLQDSWSNQGTPALPTLFGDLLPCKAELAWSSPLKRGGPASHRGDQTMEWPADTVAMAEASYRMLMRYPAVGSTKRAPRPWAEVAPAVAAFARASTKADKARWFEQQGSPDTGWLRLLSLPDGAWKPSAAWSGDRLPALASAESRQNNVDTDLLKFVNEFFAGWLGSDDFAATAAAFGPDVPAGAKPVDPARARSRELAARLQVWRLRDHGSAAALAHATQALSPPQLRQLATLAGRPDAYVRVARVPDAVLPILPNVVEPMPLLPFVIAPIAASSDGAPRATATVKFRHAPYDSVVVLVERDGGRWRVVAIDSVVEH